jgi:hypothetical protein
MTHLYISAMVILISLAILFYEHKTALSDNAHLRQSNKLFLKEIERLNGNVDELAAFIAKTRMEYDAKQFKEFLKVPRETKD